MTHHDVSNVVRTHAWDSWLAARDCDWVCSHLRDNRHSQWYSRRRWDSLSYQGDTPKDRFNML